MKKNQKLLMATQSFPCVTLRDMTWSWTQEVLFKSPTNIMQGVNCAIR